MADYSILTSVSERFAESVSEMRLRAIARRVLESEGAPAGELSVTVTDDETIRSLNREYAGQDAVTDVLSFSQREGEALVGPPDRAPPLGEVVIAYPQAARQATDPSTSSGRAETSVQREIERLLIHGLLHLLGYDHAEPEEEKRMRAREEELREAIR